MWEGRLERKFLVVLTSVGGARMGTTSVLALMVGEMQQRDESM